VTSDRPASGVRVWFGSNRASGALAADLVLYAGSAVFAGITAVASTLASHRAWGHAALFGYLVAALLCAGQLLLSARSRGAGDATTARLTGAGARAVLTGVAWAGPVGLPLLLQCAQRVRPGSDRTQEEIIVVERAGARLLASGTPYLSREAIAALPADQQLLGYTPYQPGTALFGVPRALAGPAWWSDPRIWFTAVTLAVLGLVVVLLRRSALPPARSRARDATLIRAVQLATVLPLPALTLVTSGNDLPVLALCLLALTLLTLNRPVGAGVAVGLAGALKLFAWPIAVVLLVTAVATGTRAALRLAVPALGIPVAALLPAYLIDAAALVESVLWFPLGQGLLTSPARSPLPGYLIASTVPNGQAVAIGLLLAAGLAIAVPLVLRPPASVVTAAYVCGYGLLTAIMLMPATRFGYLVYPVALLAWAPALDAGHPAPSRRTADRAEVLGSVRR
jgi:hypothetical protein